MSIHAPSCAIEPLDGRGIRNVVVQQLQGLVDASPTTMRFADLDLFEFMALTMLDDLSMSQCSGNAISRLGRTTNVSQTGGR